MKGKQKKAPIGLKLNHGCNFTEVDIAVELLLLKDFPSLKAVIIPQTIRDDRVMQKKVYDSLAKMTNKATGYLFSLLKDKAIHNGNMLGVMMIQSTNPHYNNHNEIVSIPTAIHTFLRLANTLSSESFCRQASTTSYDADCYFCMCYMPTDNFHEKEYTMACIEMFAMQWGSLGNHAVVDISEPNEHDPSHYYSDACGCNREQIMNAQTRCLWQCFLN